MKTTFNDIKGLKKDAAAIENVGGVKQLKFAGFKLSPTKPTEEQISKINQFTRREFKADELYIGQMRLANNAIDRDNERFSEEVVQRFVDTTLRKTMLLNHDRTAATGKFFDVELEKMPLQQAIAETGENLKLPDGITEVWFHSPWFFIPVEGIDPKELVKIDAGIYDWASIGFRAETLRPVMDKEGKPLFWEYHGSGESTEMTEGSLVYLGAQYGMGVKDASGGTAPDNHKEPDPEQTSEASEISTTQGGSKPMTLKEMQERMKGFFGRTFSEENIFDELKVAIAEKITEAESAVKKPLEDKIRELQPLANDGKAYRAGLVNEYVGLKVKLGEASEKPENQDAVKEVVANYPIDFLLGEIKLLKARVFEKFPTTSQLSGSATERDGSKSKVNPLVPQEAKA
jgi:hypothetical protein